MRLSPLWTGRLVAAAAAGLAGLALWSLGAGAVDVISVRTAEAAVPASESPLTAPDHTPPLPMVRLDSDEAIQTLILPEFERLGMTRVVIEERRGSATGEGMTLTEIEVKCLGRLEAGRAVLNWAAVNRPGARLVSATAHPDPQGEAAWTFVMLVGGA